AVRLSRSDRATRLWLSPLGRGDLELRCGRRAVRACRVPTRLQRSRADWRPGGVHGHHGRLARLHRADRARGCFRRGLRSLLPGEHRLGRQGPRPPLHLTAMRYEQRLIWVLGITFGFLFFDRNAASFLMPFIAKDLRFNYQQVGLIASALSFAWAVSAYLGGAISDGTPRRKPVLLASALPFSLSSFLSGLAGSFAALFAARFPMGLVAGPFMPLRH